jgi:hypothetical protein
MLRIGAAADGDRGKRMGAWDGSGDGRAPQRRGAAGWAQTHAKRLGCNKGVTSNERDVLVSTSAEGTSSVEKRAGTQASEGGVEGAKACKQAQRLGRNCWCIGACRRRAQAGGTTCRRAAPSGGRRRGWAGGGGARLGDGGDGLAGAVDARQGRAHGRKRGVDRGLQRRALGHAGDRDGANRWEQLDAALGPGPAARRGRVGRRRQRREDACRAAGVAVGLGVVNGAGAVLAGGSGWGGGGEGGRGARAPAAAEGSTAPRRSPPAPRPPGPRWRRWSRGTAASSRWRTGGRGGGRGCRWKPGLARGKPDCAARPWNPKPRAPHPAGPLTGVMSSARSCHSAKWLQGGEGAPGAWRVVETPQAPAPHSCGARPHTAGGGPTAPARGALPRPLEAAAPCCARHAPRRLTRNRSPATSWRSQSGGPPGR